MKFLTKTDFKNRITDNILSQITNDDDDLLDNAEFIAIGIVSDMLSGLFDINSELKKIDSLRHPNLLNWLLSLAIYYLYAHIPDNQVPERVIKDYNDTLNILEKIAQGKLPSSLSPILNSDKSPKRVVRFGFNKKRNHKIL